MSWIYGNYSLYEEPDEATLRRIVSSISGKKDKAKPPKSYCKRCKHDTYTLWGMCTECTI